MKKLIITIFIIFAYGIPQVFAVPPMFRYLFYLSESSSYINNYTAYANADNEIKWYLPDDRTILEIKYGDKTYRIRLADIIQEALDEWKEAFKQPAITFVRTNNINEATIHMSVNTTAGIQESFAVTSARGLFRTNRNFGEIVFNYQPIAALLTEEGAELFRKCVKKPNLSKKDILKYAIRIFAKHEPGHLFGVEHTLLTSTIDPRESLPNPRNPNETSDVTLVYRGTTEQTEPVSIMAEDPFDYLMLLRDHFGRPVNLEDITVTEADRAMVTWTNRCTNPSPPSCDTSELNAVMAAYGANNAARTTALRYRSFSSPMIYFIR